MLTDIITGIEALAPRPITQGFDLVHSPEDSDILQERANAGANNEVKYRMSRIQSWSINFALTAVAVAVSYFWLDKPIAFFAHDQLRHFTLFERLTQIPEWIAPFAVLALLILGVRALIDRPLTKLEAVILVCGLSLIVGSALKNQLKFIFGRTWPETWVRDNPSLIRDSVYGFNPFHGGQGYEAFPSGHTTAICAVMSVLWICYPRLRPLYATFVLAVAIGLIGANFHFLGDVIGGAFVGTFTGTAAVALWEAGGPTRISAPRNHGGKT